MQPRVLVGTTAQAFSYDNLYQLKTADGLYQDRSQWRHRYSLGFEYDAIGNISKKQQASFRDLPNPSGEWTPDHPDQDQTYSSIYQYASSRPHAPTRVDETLLNGQVYVRDLEYDASGNQTGWVYHHSDRRTVTWNEEDRVTKINKQGQELSRALYDGDGNRAVFVGFHGQEETAYLGANYTIRNAAYPSKHIYVDGQLIASKLDPEWFPHPPTLYFHTDHLGSAQFATNDLQELTQHDEFFPTGELWQSQTEGPYQVRRGYRFTGKELDTGSGLYYFGARWYNPRLSHWLSPDQGRGQFRRRQSCERGRWQGVEACVGWRPRQQARQTVHAQGQEASHRQEPRKARRQDEMRKVRRRNPARQEEREGGHTSKKRDAGGSYRPSVQRWIGRSFQWTGPM